MLTQQSIRDFLAQSDYDIRESGNGRWIDQKCTPDVVTVIADFIFDYVSSHPDCAFSSADIWNLDYASQTIEAVFKKPGTKNKFAKNEYNKFFQQPMEMFANAKILLKTKQGRRNIYQVNRLDILEYIALRERNALTFLKLYIIMINRITISAGASGLLLSFCSTVVSCIMPQKASFSKTFCHKLPDFT